MAAHKAKEQNTWNHFNLVHLSKTKRKKKQHINNMDIISLQQNAKPTDMRALIERTHHGYQTDCICSILTTRQ